MFELGSADPELHSGAALYFPGVRVHTSGGRGSRPRFPTADYARWQTALTRRSAMIRVMARISVPSTVLDHETTDAPGEDCPQCGHAAEGIEVAAWVNERRAKSGQEPAPTPCSSARDMGFGDVDACECVNAAHAKRVVRRYRHS